MTGVACALLAMGPNIAEARTEKVWGMSGARYLPQLVEWSLSDMSMPDQVKVMRLENDSGDAGWRFDLLAIRSLDPVELPGDPDGARFRGRHMSFSAWHSLGDSSILRLNGVAGRVSRRSGSGILLPAKTRAGYAAAELSLDHGRDWSVSAGIYRQGGWGGRSLENDLLRMTNGEPAAAMGVHAAARVAVFNGSGEPRTWLGLDVHSGRRAAGLGQALRAGSDVSLVLTSSF
ncbi:hypothetical protein ACLIMP_13460 [Novosphingobium aerophilum]|uniref:hypothetical protein n=2 Tax=Novosphingobium TaxID=165696 RepID=UPI003FD454A1